MVSIWYKENIINKLHLFSWKLIKYIINRCKKIILNKKLWANLRNNLRTKIKLENNLGIKGKNICKIMFVRGIKDKHMESIINNFDFLDINNFDFLDINNNIYYFIIS